MNPITPGTGSTVMPEWLRQRAYLTPGRLALLTSDARLTFRELDAAADNAASALYKQGVRESDIVALLSGNSTMFVLVVHAVARLGAVLMPLNVRLTASEIEWQLQDSGARFLLHDDVNAEIPRRMPGISSELRVLNTSELRDVRFSTASGPTKVGDPRVAVTPASEGRTDAGSAHPGALVPRESSADDRVWLSTAPPPFIQALDLARPQAIVYTSGTTGRPKGAILTFGNHFWSATGSALNLGLLPDDRWLACLPLFHVGGLSILFRSVIYGIPAVVHEGFDPARVNAAIDDDHVTIMSVVSAMLQRALSERGDRPYPSHLRCMLLGGGPAPPSLLEECAARGVPVVQTYGLTESSSQVATLVPEDALRKLGSAGKALFPTEVRIEREDGAPCAAGEPGEILVRGPSITPGYLNHPEESARALRGGWLHTGDIGYLDVEGYLYVLDRRDDLIVSGGENVYPAEVENALQAHPSVLEAGVVGMADERWGQTPVGFVVLREGSMLADADGLLAFLTRRLAPFKLPSRLIVDSTPLPRNAAGKLLRAELRRRLSEKV